MMVANHVSWSGYLRDQRRAAHRLRGQRAKSRRWPIAGAGGWGGHLFLQRGHRHAVHTDGRGHRRRRFDPARNRWGCFRKERPPKGLRCCLFTAACSSRRARPACRDPAGGAAFPAARRDAIPSRPSWARRRWSGNLWRVLGASGLAVESFYLPPLRCRRRCRPAWRCAASARSSIERAGWRTTRPRSNQ